MKWEDLGGGILLPITDSSRLSEDALLLARFAGAMPADTACDLGTGNGVIPLCWCRRDPPKAITAVEKNETLAALAKDAIEKNGLQERVTLIESDWTALPASLDHTFSLITCNPPYFPSGQGRPSADPVRDAMRREDTPDLLFGLFATAARLLTPDGRFCLCHRPERLQDVMAAASKAGLTSRRLQWVQTAEGVAPWLFLLEVGQKGTLRVLPPRVTGEQGSHTAVYKRTKV